jgi:hypothetical protein
VPVRNTVRALSRRIALLQLERTGSLTEPLPAVEVTCACTCHTCICSQCRCAAGARAVPALMLYLIALATDCTMH